MNDADPIPAVREEDATGEVASLYSDLRTTLRLPFVNLIWRHLATIPGGLAWTWAVLKPIYQSAELERSAAALRSGLRPPDVAALPNFVWESVSVTACDRSAIASLIADYNRANSVNLQALLAARMILANSDITSGPRRAGSPRADAPAAKPRDTPPLPSLAEMSSPLLALVRAWDELGRLGPSDALASLYRHLGHWPGFLALGYAAILPHHRSGALQAEQRRLVARAREFASTELLPLRAADTPDLAPEPKRLVAAALDEFTGLMIGRMVVMGETLLALLPAGSGRTEPS